MKDRHPESAIHFVAAGLCGVAFLLFLMAPEASAQVQAFPGAEGFGAFSTGGRGGQIIEVTNLDSDGAGSFRRACEEQGPRIVIFRVGGTILIDRDIEIEHPYITIAGQSAPGGGICLRGGALRIATHDVIIRGLRIRVGDDPGGPDPGNRDGLGIADSGTPPHDIIIDHCSISWAVDENISLWYEAHDITFQWCIISEGLNNSIHPEGSHSMGMLLGSRNVRNVSVHHNLFAHNMDRSARMREDVEIEFINNVVYDWQYNATRTQSNTNIIGNVYKVGRGWTGGKGIKVQDVPGIRVYVHDNIGPGRPHNSGDDWLAVTGDSLHRADTPVAAVSGIRTDDVETLLPLVLDNAGALAPQRDAVDQRVVQSVIDSTGNFIDSPAQVGGWPALSPGTPPADADHDGMPDEWEMVRGLNPADPADASLDRDGDGYTNVEEYLNALLPAASPPAAPFNLRRGN